MPSTIKVQNLIDLARTYPKLTSIVGNAAGGYQDAAPLAFANDTVQEILSATFNWPWNRKSGPTFLTNGLQQDYCSSLTDCAWVEGATRIEVNSTSTPKPIRGVEDKRNMYPTSVQGVPLRICGIPNAEAQLGSWVANQLYQSGIGLNSAPLQPYTQILDSNGNIQVLTTYGTTGSTQPTWATTIGATTTDSSCVWTMVDPTAVAFRVSPIPPQTGLVYQLQTFYQKKPPLITSIAQTLSPVPDELGYVLRAGFLSKCWDASGDPRSEKEIEKYATLLQRAVTSFCREQEEFGFYPERGIAGGPYRSTTREDGTDWDRYVGPWS